MSISTEITRLQQAKASIKSAIQAKGVTVPSSATLDDFAALIASIPTGSTATVATTTGTRANNNRMTFSLSGSPKAFAIITTTQITLGSTRYVLAVMSDGTNTYGTYGYRSGSSAYAYVSSSYFTWTYSDGTLSVSTTSSTNGGTWNSSATYRIIYVY